LENITTFAHWTARIMEVAGICVILLGTVIATGGFARGWRTDFEKAYREYRRHIGRAILLGLEFLVAADIIGTVAVQPTFRNLGVLALIVAIRTFLSFSLEVEINGRWPWHKEAAR
jgi:uncharacterized membrane protein